MMFQKIYEVDYEKKKQFVDLKKALKELSKSEAISIHLIEDVQK